MLGSFILVVESLMLVGELCNYLQNIRKNKPILKSKGIERIKLLSAALSFGTYSPSSHSSKRYLGSR